MIRVLKGKLQRGAPMIQRHLKGTYTEVRYGDPDISFMPTGRVVLPNNRIVLQLCDRRKTLKGHMEIAQMAKRKEVSSLLDDEAQKTFISDVHLICYYVPYPLSETTRNSEICVQRREFHRDKMYN